MRYGFRPYCIYRYISYMRCDPCSKQAADRSPLHCSPRVKLCATEAPAASHRQPGAVFPLQSFSRGRHTKHNPVAAAAYQ